MIYEFKSWWTNLVILQSYSILFLLYNRQNYLQTSI